MNCVAHTPGIERGLYFYLVSLFTPIVLVGVNNETKQIQYPTSILHYYLKLLLTVFENQKKNNCLTLQSFDACFVGTPPNLVSEVDTQSWDCFPLYPTFFSGADLAESYNSQCVHRTGPSKMAQRQD